MQRDGFVMPEWENDKKRDRVACGGLGGGFADAFGYMGLGGKLEMGD